MLRLASASKCSLKSLITTVIVIALAGVGPVSVVVAQDNQPSTDTMAPTTSVSSDGKVFESPNAAFGLESLEPSAAGTDFKGDLGLSEKDMKVEALAGPFPSSVIGSDGRTRVTGTTTYPYRAIAYLVVTFSNGSTGTCTGWFIGPRAVVTAGHCVHDGNWARTIRVYPGRNGSSTPYGSATSYRLFSVLGWTRDRSTNYDYGAIQLSSPLGNTVGWFGFRWQSSNTFSGAYTVTGYPGDKASGTLWTMTDNPGIRSVQTYRLFHAIDTYNGQSGAPLYHKYSTSCNPCSVAVHTNGVGGGSSYNSGTRITQAVYNNLVSWKNYAYP